MEEDPLSEPFGIWEQSGEDLILAIQTDSENPEFARGIQVGIIWQLLFSEVDEFEIPVYASNAEMVMRLCETLHYSYEAKYEEEVPQGIDRDWMIVSFKRNKIAAE